jgi:signal peptidase I
MASTNIDKTESDGYIKKDRAAEVANTFEWLITAFILAFVFRAFVMEAFRIPTGSMAETLMGAHFSLRCAQCGYEYNYGFIPERYNLQQDSLPSGGSIKPFYTRCPSCGYYQLTSKAAAVSNGDRILVLKCLYQFIEANRWDVIVFKNPLEPQINYIKRLIGRPGEIVEIIDGDIYINGEIARKPPKVQQELWMPIYDNDYQPARPFEGLFNSHFWQQPFDVNNSQWKIDSTNPTMFQLNSLAEQICHLTYNTAVGNDFKTSYAYDDVDSFAQSPYCSDLMMRFYASPASSKGVVGIALSKYQTNYKALVDFSGDMIIAKASQGQDFLELARTSIKPLAKDLMPVKVEFANVDHQLIFQVGSNKLTYDLERDPNGAGLRETEIQPTVQILGSGKVTLSHVALFRDIYYTATKTPDGKAGRASEGNPFRLGSDEFFALGDNSPNSADSRYWNQRGRGNNGAFFRQGVVPREYLVGKALFVYWPSGFRVFAGSRFALIPNIGQMRFIYGGAKEYN